MDYRTNFRSLGAVLVMAMLCISAAPALGKGKPPKPDPDQPTRPHVNYDITWLNLEGTYEELSVRDVNPQGTTIVGLTTTAAGVRTAVKIEFATGVATPIIVDLNDVVPEIPSGWHLTSAQDITRSGRIAGELIDDQGLPGLYVYDAALSADPFQIFAVVDEGGGGVGFRDIEREW